MEIPVNLLEVLISTVTTICSVGIVVYKLGRAVEKFENVGVQQAKEISEVKEEVKVLGTVMTKIALHTQRQEIFEERLNRYEKEIADFRRGEGFIMRHPSTV